MAENEELDIASDVERAGGEGSMGVVGGTGGSVGGTGTFTGGPPMEELRARYGESAVEDVEDADRE